jgi:hypothetical protein
VSTARISFPVLANFVNFPPISTNAATIAGKVVDHTCEDLVQYGFNARDTDFYLNSGTFLVFSIKDLMLLLWSSLDTDLLGAPSISLSQIPVLVMLE